MANIGARVENIFVKTAEFEVLKIIYCICSIEVQESNRGGTGFGA